MKSRSPTKVETAWMAKLTELGCCVCWREYDVFTPTEIHHLDGKTKPEAHLKTIGLCYRHHREGVNNDRYVSRHPFKREFEKRYGTESSLLDWTRQRIGQ
mgnify:CR=1 FL=1